MLNVYLQINDQMAIGQKRPVDGGDRYARNASVVAFGAAATQWRPLGTEENMVNVYEQQRVYRSWLDAAHGDIRTVERALNDVMNEPRGRREQPSRDEVLCRIKELVRQHETQAA